MASARHRRGWAGRSAPAAGSGPAKVNPDTWATLSVACRAGLAVVAAPGFGADSELELAALVADQAGPGEGVVLLAGGQAPGRLDHRRASSAGDRVGQESSAIPLS